MSKAELGKDLFDIIHNATSKTMPEFASAAGIYGMKEAVAADLMKDTTELLVELKKGTANDDMLDSYLAKCRLAEASSVLATKSVDRIHEIIEEFRKDN